MRKDLGVFFYIQYRMTVGDIFTPKNANIYYCKICDFQCSKQSDWSRHIVTLKHKNGDIVVTNGDNEITETCLNLRRGLYPRNNCPGIAR